MQLWGTVMPHATVDILEFNRPCAQEFQPKLESLGGRMFIGSKTNTSLLQHIVDEAEVSNALYDIIVDDGDHEPDHQLTALLHLWPALRVSVQLTQQIMQEILQLTRTS